MQRASPTGRFLVAVAATYLVAPAPAAAPAAAAAPLHYFLVVTGGELLDGQLQDGHTHFLARTLRPLGLRCAGALTVDDRREDILAALRFATNAAPLVLVTGGLGPTPNDITRETLSEFTAIPLRESEAAVSELERRFRQPRDQFRPNLRRQCLVPERGGFLPNPHGTAVGLIFDLGPDRALVALPGPPRELQPMVRVELLPWLERRYGTRSLGSSLTLRFVGVGQSQIAQTVEDQVGLPPEVIVTSLFEAGRVDFTFHLPGATDADQARLRRLGEEVRRHLGEFCYAEGDTSLEEVVLRAFRDRQARLALAEAGTGGELAAALGRAPSAGAVLLGAWNAPDQPRLAALLGLTALPPDPETCVRRLAGAAATQAGVPWAFAVVAPGAETADAPVWLAVRAGERVTTHRLSWRDRSPAGRAGLVTALLDQLRRGLGAP